MVDRHYYKQRAIAAGAPPQDLTGPDTHTLFKIIYSETYQDRSIATHVFR